MLRTGRLPAPHGGGLPPPRPRDLARRRECCYRGPWRLPGPDSHRLAAVNLSLGYVVVLLLSVVLGARATGRTFLGNHPGVGARGRPAAWDRPGGRDNGRSAAGCRGRGSSGPAMVSRYLPGRVGPAGRAGTLALRDIAVDGCITKAPGGRECAGPSPVDRRKQDMKRSALVEGCGIPLGRVRTGAHRHDSPLLAPTLDKLRRPRIAARGHHRAPRRRLRLVHDPRPTRRAGPRR